MLRGPPWHERAELRECLDDKELQREECADDLRRLIGFLLKRAATRGGTSILRPLSSANRSMSTSSFDTVGGVISLKAKNKQRNEKSVSIIAIECSAYIQSCGRYELDVKLVIRGGVNMKQAGNVCSRIRLESSSRRLT